MSTSTQDTNRLSRRTAFRLQSVRKEEDQQNDASGAIPYDILLGNNELASPQFGIAAKTMPTEEHPRERTVAFDFNHVHCLSIFGQPGGGKSYTMGTVMEMAVQGNPGINHLPNPLCTMMFHYSSSEVSEPEFVTMGAANSNSKEVDLLQQFYQAGPAACQDLVVLSPKEALERRRREFPSLRVEPLTFSPQELRVPQWKILMGAVGEQSMYLEVMKMAMKRCRAYLNIPAVRREITESALSDHEKDVAGIRMDLLESYIDKESGGIMRHCKPGRMIIVDMRDEFLEKDEVFSLLMVLMQVFGDATYRSDDEWAAFYAGDEPELNERIDALEAEWAKLQSQRLEAEAQGESGPQTIDWYKRQQAISRELRGYYNQKAEAELDRLRDGSSEHDNGQKVNKLVVYDEAHKFMANPSLVATLTEAIREMRHKACSIMIASQDPPSVPKPILELSTHLILHKMTAPGWLDHVKTINASLHSLGIADVATLKTGEAWVWATKASEHRYATAPTKVRFRTRFSQHGGATKTAVKGTETTGV